MTNTPMDDIEDLRRKLINDYPRLWQQIVSDWEKPESQSAAWLMYSANYLCRSGSVRWAIDPFTLHARLPQSTEVSIQADLKQLDYILLTHRHADHLDLELIRALQDSDIRWIIPDDILSYLKDQVHIDPSHIIHPHHLESLSLNGLAVIPFNSPHWEWLPGDLLRNPTTASHGIPQMGYLVEHAGYRWLFPGDIRTYDITILPKFENIHTVFAHIWLGRKQALSEIPPLLEEFCQFYRSINARRIVVTHLEEVGRSPRSLWTNRHHRLVHESLGKSGACVESARIGDRIILEG